MVGDGSQISVGHFLWRAKEKGWAEGYRKEPFPVISFLHISTWFREAGKCRLSSYQCAQLKIWVLPGMKGEWIEVWLTGRVWQEDQDQVLLAVPISPLWVRKPSTKLPPQNKLKFILLFCWSLTTVFSLEWIGAPQNAMPWQFNSYWLWMKSKTFVLWSFIVWFCGTAVEFCWHP